MGTGGGRATATGGGDSSAARHSGRLDPPCGGQRGAARFSRCWPRLWEAVVHGDEARRAALLCACSVKLPDDMRYGCRGRHRLRRRRLRPVSPAAAATRRPASTVAASVGGRRPRTAAASGREESAARSAWHRPVSTARTADPSATQCPSDWLLCSGRVRVDARQPVSGVGGAGSVRLGCRVLVPLTGDASWTGGSCAHRAGLAARRLLNVSVRHHATVSINNHRRAAGSLETRRG